MLSFAPLVSALANLVKAIQDNTKALNALTAVQKRIAGFYLTPTKLVTTFQGGLPGMSAQVQEGLLILGTDAEYNAEGDQLTIADPTRVTYVSSDPTIAQILYNADNPVIPVGGCGVKGLKVGSVTVTSTDNSVTPPLVGDPVACDVTLDPVANKLVTTLAPIPPAPQV